MTLGLLHFPSQKQDIYMADFKVALRKWKSCVCVHKASMKSRKGGEGDNLNFQYSRDSCSTIAYLYKYYTVMKNN